MSLLRETPRSLRQYFGLVAGLQIISLIASFSRNATGWKTFTFWDTAVFAAVYLYIVIRFPILLPRPTFIKAVLAISLVQSLAWFAYTARFGVGLQQVAILVLTCLVYWYIWRSVVRLSAQANAAPAVAA